MQGTVMIYRPGPIASEPEVREFDHAPRLDELQKIVGGYIEAVPGFQTITYHGEPRACVAFCNEEGKLEGLSVNRTATLLWHAALPSPGLRLPNGSFSDVLCGPVVVLYGDDEFMGAL